jgi:hypothetical protein
VPLTLLLGPTAALCLLRAVSLTTWRGPPQLVAARDVPRPARGGARRRCRASPGPGGAWRLGPRVTVDRMAYGPEFKEIGHCGGNCRTSQPAPWAGQAPDDPGCYRERDGDQKRN